MRFGPGRIERLRLPPGGFAVTLAVLLAATPIAVFSQAAIGQTPPCLRITALPPASTSSNGGTLAADAFRQFIKKYPNHERVPYARLYLGMTLVNGDHLAELRDKFSANTLATTRGARAFPTPCIAWGNAATCSTI